ncbi:twin-arginine translocase TatA/TatE family subunit [Enterobacter bugandensis]
MGSISIWQLLTIVVIVALLLGTQKMGSLGSDLGISIKGFKKVMRKDDAPEEKGVAMHDADFAQTSLSEVNEGSLQGSVEPHNAERV